MKPITEYMDYRELLRDFYQEKKRESSYFSYRLFSQQAGFKAPNLLKLVMDGKRRLTKESVYKFAKGMRLNKGEAEYFEDLVFFNQAASLDEKNLYLQRLMRLRRRSDPRRIESSEYEYYSAWYHPVIREVATSVDFKDDYKRLAAMVTPAISPDDARKSVELLLRLGFIRKTPDGRYESASASLTTGPRVRSIAVANYHKDMMKLAAESIERFKADQRDITSLTLNVDDKTRQAMVEKIRQLREELLAMAETNRDPSQVMQVNFQLFPLSEPYNGGEVQS
ncbi:MAG: TIGR02147 family protein [Chitinivibrionales bacterium]|nr:TIGR02147 family protein [Chitinivibrionales bacterium]